MGTGMTDRRTNLETAVFAHGSPSREGEPPYRFLDLSGEALGVRVEEIEPGGTTSHPHYHVSEEEHVVLLSGEASLHLGHETLPLKAGDHVWFPAGEAVPHHIENTSDQAIRLLVFGERKRDDVVVYPKAEMMMIKSASGMRMVAYHEEETNG